MTRRVDPEASAAEVPPAKLLIGAIVADRVAWAAAEVELAAAFGPFDPCVLALPFDHTAYYRSEMGDGLLRVFRVHREPVRQDALAAIKRRAVAIERRLAEGEGPEARRRVNIDPGLLGLAGLVLASTKGYAHRVYLGEGIFAEPTLLWRAGGFRPVAWTYPDYQRPESLAFFAAARNALRRRLRAAEGEPVPCC
jgi:hypothetical protein